MEEVEATQKGPCAYAVSTPRNKVLTWSCVAGNSGPWSPLSGGPAVPSSAHRLPTRQFLRDTGPWSGLGWTRQMGRVSGRLLTSQLHMAP